MNSPADQSTVVSVSVNVHCADSKLSNSMHHLLNTPLFRGDPTPKLRQMDRCDSFKVSKRLSLLFVKVERHYSFKVTVVCVLYLHYFNNKVFFFSYMNSLFMFF